MQSLAPIPIKHEAHAAGPAAQATTQAATDAAQRIALNTLHPWGEAPFPVTAISARA